MALTKHPIVIKEEILNKANKFDEVDFLFKSKKRSSNQFDENPRENFEELVLPQKKRAYLGSIPGVFKGFKKSSEDQDDETLIRETQAALKSLSGSWADNRDAMYKINEQSDNPSFQNLFEGNKGKPEEILKQIEISKYAKQTRDKEFLLQRQRFEKFHSKPLEGRSNYHPVDFNELVDESSSEEEEDDKVRKLREYKNGFKFKSQFSQNSAFKPLESRKGFNIYSVDPNYYQELGNRDEPLPKSLNDAVDSKQYTMLQPAGIGSKAASVLKDIAREGIVSVSAVTSTSSPGLENVSSSTLSHFDRMHYSSNKGN